MELELSMFNKKQPQVFLFLIVLLSSLSFNAIAADNQAMKTTFQKLFPQLEVDSVEVSPIKGLYQLTLSNGQIVFSNKALDHILVEARMFKVNGPGDLVDLTQAKQNKSREQMIQDFDESEMVIFKGKGENTIPLYVFTDVDCGYCRKMHSEIDQLNAAGIDVMYMAWPRSGVDSEVGEKMHNIWCAENPLKAMTQAKSGGTPAKGKKNCVSPLAKHLKLGVQMGVQGTPAVFTEEGEQVGGYVPATDLIKMLKAQN